MAQRKVVLMEYTDDLTGSVLDQANVHTICFAWAGNQYEIDLSQANAEKMEQLLKPYIDAARKAGRPARVTRLAGSGTRVTSRRDKDELRAIRNWAAENGFAVPSRGRIKGEIIQAFEAAHARYSPQACG